MQPLFRAPNLERRTTPTPRSTTVLLTATALLLALAPAASALGGGGFSGATQLVEATVVVPTGSDTASYGPILDPVTSTHGPFHGTLDSDGGLYEYTPSDSFWQVGSDVTMLYSQSGSVLHRVRWVVGQSGFDGPVGAMEDPGYGQWSQWVLDATPGYEIEVIPGETTDDAYAFDSLSGVYQSMKIDLDDPAGNGGSTTTTSDFHIIIDDIGFDLGQMFIPPKTFYEVSQGTGNLVAQLQVRWNSFLNLWEIRVVTSLRPNTAYAPLTSDNNRIRLIRWNHATHAGVRLQVNDETTHTIESPVFLSNSAEQHELLMDGHTSLFTNLRLVFEQPIVRSSGTFTSLMDPSVEDSFDTGFGGWSMLGVQGGVASGAQQLPGPGTAMLLDLDLLGPNQSSYLEKGSGSATPSLDADGHAVRFWVDPSNMVLPKGPGLTVFTACAGNITPCNAMRLRLDGTPNGPALVALAGYGTLNVAQIATPISNAPNLVEMRMRNAAFPGSNSGWIELWVNGAFEGRVEGLTNYDQPVGVVRLGALVAPVGISGEVLLDAFELWRFD